MFLVGNCNPRFVPLLKRSSSSSNRFLITTLGKSSLVSSGKGHFSSDAKSNGEINETGFSKYSGGGKKSGIQVAKLKRTMRRNIAEQVVGALGPADLDESAVKIRDDVLSRTTVVEDSQHCDQIVDKILARGDTVVAVDMEGTQHSVLGMIQLKTLDGNIYLFRTARNTEMLKSGRLKDLMESPAVVKVMHAATGDCGAIYKEGVRMWNLYDTALAEQVIAYQNRATPVYDTYTISFNNCCAKYGFKVNPLKEAVGKNVMKNPEYGAIWSWETLTDDLVYYSAYDVEPLLDIYNLQSPLISPDFKPLFKMKCDQEMIRCVDPSGARAMRDTIFRSYDQNAIYVSGYEPFKVSKAHIYEALNNVKGQKQVLSKDHAAENTSKEGGSLVVFENRKLALEGHDLLDNNIDRFFGTGARVSLVKELSKSEVKAALVDQHYETERLKELDFLVDFEIMHEAVEMLLKAGGPLVLNMVERMASVEVNIYIGGEKPPLKIYLNDDSLNRGGIGNLLASKSVVKVVSGLNQPVAQAFQLATNLGHSPANVFDISMAFKMVDYVEYGQTISRRKVYRIPEMMLRLGLDHDENAEHHTLLLAYLHLKKILPEFVKEQLNERLENEVEIVSLHQMPALAKKRRRLLRDAYEASCLHVKSRHLSGNDLEKFLQQQLNKASFEFSNIWVRNENAIVQLNKIHVVQKAVNYLNQINEADSSQRLTVSYIDTDVKQLPERDTKFIDSKRLHQEGMTQYLKSLRKMGFFELEIPDSKKSSSGKKQQVSILEQLYGSSEENETSAKRKV